MRTEREASRHQAPTSPQRSTTHTSWRSPCATSASSGTTPSSSLTSRPSGSTSGCTERAPKPPSHRLACWPMSEHYDEDLELLVLRCDAQGCPETLSNWGKEITFGPMPAPHTGWITTGKGTPDRWRLLRAARPPRRFLASARRKPRYCAAQKRLPGRSDCRTALLRRSPRPRVPRRPQASLPQERMRSPAPSRSSQRPPTRR
jgi:hypothetical protein